LIFRGVDDTGVTFRTVLAAASQASAADVVLKRLLPLAPECLHRFLSFCVSYPHKAHTVNEVAEALGLSRKTFVNYSARTRMLPPAELLAWSRLCLAAYYLTHSMMTVEAIALQLDFASCTALRNMMKRYTALRAKEVRAQGGLSCVLRRFEAALAAHRARIAARSPTATSP
jgi:transcriptional regulator GlxA family with amidase domain